MQNKIYAETRSRRPLQTIRSAFGRGNQYCGVPTWFATGVMTPACAYRSRAIAAGCFFLRKLRQRLVHRLTTGSRVFQYNRAETTEAIELNSDRDGHGDQRLDHLHDGAALVGVPA